MDNIKKPKSKSIRSIQFLPSQVIVDLGENRVFHFCKDCKDGKHLKNFLNDAGFGPDLQRLSDDEAARLERRMYYNLSRGAMRYTFYFEGQSFINRVKKRCALPYS